MFIHDTENALRAATALVNSLPEIDGEGVDRLANLDDMTEFLQEYPYTGAIRRDDVELDQLRSARSQLRQLWTGDRVAAVPIVNAMLRDGRALPQLVIHDGYDWHIHATDDAAPLATRITVEVAMAFVDVIRSDEFDRVRVCSADDCEAVYIDYSKNGSKRYCDTGNCGNRMNVNAYRRRKAEESA
ncbi:MULTISPECIES: CGNR zinc finger domain-containing protein [Microbacterium]|uniref:CGNR zinc finger domain-containing protein n=1 Tax=Microbacterium aquilitoris TaxID=3067307 RepID=A0ABU3GLG3_9MICO|nr:MULTISPECIES: CGNR zinc finger domain-containing protein [unclassified Microbacterium]MDT3331539.1 CGNR zinc finger domain-containing protein [Microbacterium sp. KSW-18]MDT3343690.1 CGNR zinc finger domain-containing protein [Microbacterium sp. KSW2-22]SDH01579.1 Putative stress-induced transcription regulator [Microbacterium sp. 77mftsu3.1]